MNAQKRIIRKVKAARGGSLRITKEEYEELKRSTRCSPCAKAMLEREGTLYGVEIIVEEE